MTLLKDGASRGKLPKKEAGDAVKVLTEQQHSDLVSLVANCFHLFCK